MSDLSKNQKTILYLMGQSDDRMRHIDQPRDVQFQHLWTIDKGLKIYCASDSIAGLLSKGLVILTDDFYLLTDVGRQRAKLIAGSLAAERRRVERKASRRAELQSNTKRENHGKESQRQV